MPPAQPRKPDPAAEANERNQYIPNFIANKPFYVPDDGSSHDYLEHQRLQKAEDSSLAKSKWYERGAKSGPAATKYRKGACENCGSMSHKTKDCLSRPRKQGAKWTGRDIQADEVVGNVNLGWDAKRDRWNGYDAREYQNIIDDFNELEKIKKEKGVVADDEESAKYEEETDMGTEQSTSTRNLRLREDTAKYLLNLDLDSTKYDPKTRSMIEDGTGTTGEEISVDDGFVKKSGDAAEFERAQRYAWETQESGKSSKKLHLEANPTAGALAIKKAETDAIEKKAARQKALLEKYGGSEYLDQSPAKDILVTESERFVEYDETGGIKGAPKIKPKSKYAEDVFPGNHKSVWGSWWQDFKWGYECCHSFVKNSYCTGDSGKEAFEEEQRRKAGMDIEDEPEEQRAIEDAPRDVEAESAKRKRNIEEMRDGITEEDMEEYRRKRTNAEDPMAKMLGKDKLVH